MLDDGSVFDVMGLGTRKDQQDTVLPRDRRLKYVGRYAAQSLAEALLQPGSWIRTLHAGGDLVGFIWAQSSDDQLLLRRMLVEGEHQGRGYGRRAVEMMLDEFPGAGSTRLQCLPGPCGPRDFFQRLGFTPTGEMVGEEIVMERIHCPARAACELAVTLHPITPENLVYICNLDAEGPVAPNAVSVVQAHQLDGAYLRAIYAGELPVGLIMMHEDRSEDEPEFFLWRLGVDAEHQRRGYGARALALLMEYARQRGALELLTSCEPGPDGPVGFYTKLGFKPTGDWLDDEMIMKLPL